MNTEQTLALKLADALEFPTAEELDQAAAELRRLHAENQSLRARPKVTVIAESLYDRTGDIKDINTVLIGRDALQELEEAWAMLHAKPVSPELDAEICKALTIEGQSPTNIHGPFNACMYQDHCKAMEQQATARAMTDQEILDAADAIAAKRLAEQKAEREKLVNTTCQLCNSGRLKLDSNAYFEFLRCEQCNHVPLFIDGQDAAALARAGEKT